MDRAEQLFLNFISSFTAEDIKNCMFNDYDLAKMALEEIPDYVEGFRQLVSSYDRDHQGWKDAARQDYDVSANVVINFLKQNRPDLGYEIDSYKERPTASSLGISSSSQAVVTSSQAAVTSDVHVGRKWVATNMKSLMELFFP